MKLKVKYNDARVRMVLDKFPTELRQAIKKETFRVADSIVDYARNHHAFITRSGLLEQSYHWEAEEDTDRGLKIEITNTHLVPYGLFLEIGTSPHIIEAVNKEALHFVVNGEDIFCKYAFVSGITPKPVLYPALMAHVEEIQDIFSKAVQSFVNQSAEQEVNNMLSEGV